MEQESDYGYYEEEGGLRKYLFPIILVVFVIALVVAFQLIAIYNQRIELMTPEIYTIEGVDNVARVYFKNNDADITNFKVVVKENEKFGVEYLGDEDFAELSLDDVLITNEMDYAAFIIRPDALCVEGFDVELYVSYDKCGMHIERVHTVRIHVDDGLRLKTEEIELSDEPRTVRLVFVNDGKMELRNFEVRTESDVGLEYPEKDDCYNFATFTDGDDILEGGECGAVEFRASARDAPETYMINVQYDFAGMHRTRTFELDVV